MSVSTECGVISDVVQSGGEGWNSALSVMLSEKGGSNLNPLNLVGKIVEFYVEILISELLTLATK